MVRLTRFAKRTMTYGLISLNIPFLICFSRYRGAFWKIDSVDHFAFTLRGRIRSQQADCIPVGLRQTKPIA